MTKTLSLRNGIGLAAAITAWIALSRFTGGDWIGGTIFAAAVAGFGVSYFLIERRPRDTRRY
jgi:multisubunit Na+/H+ antiporter MnhE subunit